VSAAGSERKRGAYRKGPALKPPNRDYNTASKVVNMILLCLTCAPVFTGRNAGLVVFNVRVAATLVRGAGLAKKQSC
jgi:hypothetical protein